MFMFLVVITPGQGPPVPIGQYQLSPAGVPSTNDTVTLSNGGVNSILLDGNRTITRLIISANTIDLNTYELHVSGRSSLNGGAINNGNLKIRGTYAYFQGTNFNCTLDVIAGQIKFSGGTFDKTGSFEQNGTASGWGLGGCTFNDDVTIKNTGTVYLRMGQDGGDTFNGKVYLYSSGNYSLQMAYGDTSYFNDTIYVNSTGNGGINFANGTYGASILGDSACLITGSSGISAGTIQFKNMVQSATSSNSITASGSVLFNVYSNSFLGKVNFTAPNLVVKSTTLVIKYFSYQNRTHLKQYLGWGKCLQRSSHHYQWKHSHRLCKISQPKCRYIQSRCLFQCRNGQYSSSQCRNQYLQWKCDCKWK
ncbi:MAG: hypothetical protein IPO63_07680 [Bacteroidetes bacterium]|nr:hypothetical protein [Bacteroidota bacterium]